MYFEYDVNKSVLNKEKHGITFEDAKLLWDSVSVVVKVQSGPETRYILIGILKNKFYTCVFTKRPPNIRIISCRRSRKSEEALFREKVKS